MGDKIGQSIGSTEGATIAMGFIARDKSEPGTSVDIDTGKGTLPAKVVPLPFYKAPKPS
jgi:glycine cleavage system aminomethyltransferase T